MHASTLQPPNSQQLSDQVIADVAQRARPSRFNGVLLVPVDARSSTVPPSAGIVAQILSAQRNKRATSLSEREANARAAAELKRRRERNRLHQARYKAEQKQRMEGLEVCIKQLQGEIQELQMQRHVLSVTMPKMKTLWSVVAEYFYLFRHGVQSPRRANSLCAVDPVVQRDFLLSTMASDVTDGRVRGVDAIMENWTRMSLYNPGIAIDLTCLEEAPDGSVIATTKHPLTITECMLRCAFPHLIGPGGEISPIGEKIIGREVMIYGSVLFEWDNDSNRVASFVFKGDLLTPMLKLLGDLDEVSRVFEGAGLTPECGLDGP